MMLAFMDVDRLKDEVAAEMGRDGGVFEEDECFLEEPQRREKMEGMEVLMNVL